MRPALFFMDMRTYLPLVLAVSLAAGCGDGGDGGSPPPESPAVAREERRELPAVPVHPNASRVVATVLDVSAKVTNSAAKARLSSVAPPSSYAVRIKVETSQPAQVDQDGLAVPGTEYTVYSQGPVDTHLANQKIDATLVLNGTNYGVWWEISKIAPHPRDP